MPLRSFNKWRKFTFAPEWKKKTGELNNKLTEFYRLFKSRNYPTPDELFFEIEDLPSMGKEYWFLHFCSPPREEQVIFTFGRSVDPVKVNKASVPEADEQQGGDEFGLKPAACGSMASGGEPQAIAGARHSGLKEAAPAHPNSSVVCAAVCWLHTKKGKQVIFDTTTNVRLKKGEKNSIIAEKGDGKISITGKYPHFDISLEKGGKRIFYAHAAHPRKGHPYEMVNILENPFAPSLGTVMINYYFEFEGVLHGKPMKGKAYLQKVVAAMPLAPWNWVRLEFGNGDSLDFFTGKPLGDKAGWHIASNAYIELAGRRVKLKGLKLQTWLEGEKRVWLLTNKNLIAVLESYSVQPFIMRQKTVFQYDEFLVRVKAFAFKDGAREYTLEDLGGGVGIAEDASGYLF